MSNSLFPLDLIATSDVTPTASVITDAFTDGTTSSRRFWPAQNFKRTFKLTTPPLAENEVRYLRSFISQRGGMYDAFWLRDNPNRGGQALVRFSKDPTTTWKSGARIYTLECQEIAPIRALPEFDEVAVAAGAPAAVWYDANRERAVNYAGQSLIYDSATWDAATLTPGNRAAWQANATGILASLGQQYPAYSADGAHWAVSPSPIGGLTSGQPALSLFALVNVPNAGAQKVLFALGAAGSGTALGLQITAANNLAPWVGLTESWTGALQANTAATWYSLAAVWPASSNVASFYVNGALIGTATNTRSLGAAPAASLLASPGGTLIAASGALVHHAMAIPAALNLSQVKALHNLLGYQAGLASV